MRRLDYVGRAVDGWAKLRPDDDLEPLLLVQALVWSGRVSEEMLERAAFASGLRRRGDYEVLALLRRSEPDLLRPIDVAEQHLSSPSGMTTRLDRLEALGLLERLPDPSDRRVIKLRLTDQGRSLVDNAFDLSMNLYRSFLAGLTEQDLKELNRLLRAILDRLDDLSQRQEPWRHE